MSVRFLGDAEKTFSQIEKGEDIYYIDPKKPTEIQALRIKSVTEWEMKKGWVTLEYYQSTNALSMTPYEDTIPTRKIQCDGRTSRIITISLPPTVYFTNKRALEKFMGSDFKR